MSNKIAVVTGAAGVLCSAMVKRLVSKGWKVVLIGRTESKLLALKKECDQITADHAMVCAGDVTSKTEMQSVLVKIHQAWGKVSLLVNGAGGNQAGATSPLEELKAGDDLTKSFFGLNMDAYQEVFKLNLVGTVVPCQVFAEDMLDTGTGNIVNFSSVSANLPLTKVCGYSNAKAAVDSFTQWLAVHFAKRGIRVNAIMPGFFVTEQNRFLLHLEDGKTLSPRGHKIISNTPMGRFGSSEELGSALDFLISDESKFVTGTVVAVDGGFSAFGKV
jgi:NAD(P)-dependent dehydrogenase (short-subunit alcohol dehydrogenase family)